MVVLAATVYEQTVRTIAKRFPNEPHGKLGGGNYGELHGVCVVGVVSLVFRWSGGVDSAGLTRSGCFEGIAVSLKLGILNPRRHPPPIPPRAAKARRATLTATDPAVISISVFLAPTSNPTGPRDRLSNELETPQRGSNTYAKSVSNTLALPRQVTRRTSQMGSAGGGDETPLIHFSRTAKRKSSAVAKACASRPPLPPGAFLCLNPGGGVSLVSSLSKPTKAGSAETAKHPVGRTKETSKSVYSLTGGFFSAVGDLAATKRRRPIGNEGRVGVVASSFSDTNALPCFGGTCLACTTEPPNSGTCLASAIGPVICAFRTANSGPGARGSWREKSVTVISTTAARTVFRVTWFENGASVFLAKETSELAADSRSPPKVSKHDESCPIENFPAGTAARTTSSTVPLSAEPRVTDPSSSAKRAPVESLEASRAACENKSKTRLCSSFSVRVLFFSEIAFPEPPAAVSALADANAGYADK